ncbi:MAG TPA: ion transporter [Candidatus Limnocylindrales bacterium]|nr:ion transporter [Candidatus Limnocylindrales bacterium]
MDLTERAGPGSPEPRAQDMKHAVRQEREALLEHVRNALDGVMVALSAAWIALLVAELVAGSLPPSLDIALWVIWAIFIADFVLEFSIAPRKGRYLRENWLSALSLALPALRIVRVFGALRVLRAARVVRSVGLLRILTSVNRGLASLRATAARRGLGYVLAATALVMLVGSAGMASFESPAAIAAEGSAVRPLADFGEALWWTAFAMTTGATSPPATAEGRLLGWLLSLYGLGIFGYLTAMLASHFVGREAPQRSG